MTGRRWMQRSTDGSYALLQCRSVFGCPAHAARAMARAYRTPRERHWPEIIAAETSRGRWLGRGSPERPAEEPAARVLRRGGNRFFQGVTGIGVHRATLRRGNFITA